MKISMIDPKDIVAILFDLDGTLNDYIDTSQIQADNNALALVPKDGNLRLLYDETKKEFNCLYMSGKLSHNDFYDRKIRYDMFLEKLGMTDKKLSTEMESVFLKTLETEMRSPEDVIPTLSKIKEHYKIGIITNGLRRYQELKINSLKLNELLDYFFVSEDVHESKPSAKFYEYALKKMNLKPDQCFMVGDDPNHDIKGANESGIITVFYNPNNQKVNCDPIFEIKNISDLLKVLQLTP